MMGADNEKRYAHGEVECIDAIRAALTDEEFRGFCKGNVMKYIWRERYKGGDGDLHKAEDYLGWACEVDGDERYVSEETAKRLESENAKLWELVRVMAYCMQEYRDCDGCAINDADGVVTAPSGCDWLRDRMRELGVVE